MLLLYGALVALFAINVNGQLFGGPFMRFGLDFPGFTAPEAFEDEQQVGFGGIGGIQERISKLLKGAGKSKPGVKTKVKTERKGDTNITTVEQKGKGFNSWARLTTYENGDKNNSKSFSNMFSEAFGGSNDQEQREKKSECSGQKPCKEGNYCDPIQGVCKPTLPRGAVCFLKDQCSKEDEEICIWGRCSNGKAGQPGTFCQNHKDCIAETYCTHDSQLSIFHPICKPRLSEGASCSSASPLRIFKFIIGKRSVQEEQPNPCKNGLKCERIGLFGGMTCVPESLATKPSEKEDKGDKDLEETDEEASSGDKDIDEKEDNNQGGDIVPSNEKENEEEKPEVPEQGEENVPEQGEENVPEQGKGNQGEKQQPKVGGQPPTNKPGQQPNNPDLGQKIPDNNLPYPPPAKKNKKKKNRKNKKIKKTRHIDVQEE